MRVSVARALAHSSDFWAYVESKVPQNGRFPALDADEPLCKLWDTSKVSKDNKIPTENFREEKEWGVNTMLKKFSTK